GLAALHLVGQRRFVDLDHHRVGIDAEILHQRLGDVAHHAGLLLVGAASGHAHGNLRHFSLPVFLFNADSLSYLLPLWEKVARIDRCEPDEGSLSAETDPSPGALRAPPSPTRGEGINPTSRHAAPALRAPWRRSRLPCRRTGQAASPAIPGWRRSRRPLWRPRSDP